jgi:hypothetical protein
MKKRPGKTKLRPDEWGPHVSEIRGKIRDTFSVCLSGRGWLLFWAGFAPRGPFLFLFSLLLFLFCFLISFITFAFVTQIDSNQLCKVSKIQNNNPEQ